MTATPTTYAAPNQTELLSVDADYLWHPWSPSRVSPDTLVAVYGEGCEVRDADGRTYLDAKSSGLNATLGYGCRAVTDAISAQLAQLMTYDMGEGANVPAIRLAQRIAGLVGPRLTRTFFCNSGSEAVETSLRIARFYHAVSDEPERTLVVSLDNAYHGATMAAAACSAGSSPIAPEVAPAGFVTVRGPGGGGGGTGEGGDSDGAGAGAGAGALRDFLAEHGHRTAAVVVEPVQARGAHVVPDAYLRAVRRLCTDHGVLLILDEVTTGFGRTGRMFGFQHAGVEPDILATSKGLAAGYMSLAAVTTTQHVFEVFDRNKGKAGFVHGHTHSGHAAACAAGLAVIDVIEENDVLGNVRTRGAQLLTALEPLRALPYVRELRGRGLLAAVELDSSRRAARVRGLMRQDGVLVRRTGRNIVLAPPLIISETETARLAGTLVTAVRAAAAHAAGTD
ncbi:aminotransferase family protein [Streptomyces yaizuensis]|uniref:Aspartate aminotransferase family protein n=1 Tax=Streptomyces yaizuensis TaxID=2989713 RepID=A0ABQ5P8H4_9ACTN|nr:aminotransferase class III-fold pyridoxal phosphate-dependent enzyme [Streptomyces sp. YSPA8]GLF98765.1 aspartate aminotransferase family protein [Streptomyces sp. YSPA8]